MRIIQIYQWFKDSECCNIIFINIELLESIRLEFHDPYYNRSDLYGVIFPDKYKLGLSVFQITMSSGQIISVPVPWAWNTDIWKQLQIDEP